MLRRLGSALILIGVVLMVVYLVSSTVESGQAPLLLAGAAVSVLGLYFRRAGAKKEERSIARFRTVRKWMGDPAEQDEEQRGG